MVEAESISIHAHQTGRPCACAVWLSGTPTPTLVFCPHQQLATHLWKHGEALEALETSIKSSRRLENLCRDFELQKVCYLPLNTFLLRPLHRLMHYKQVLERLCKHHPPSHADFRDCRGERRVGTASPAERWGSAGQEPCGTVPQAFTALLFSTWSNIFCFLLIFL